MHRLHHVSFFVARSYETSRGVEYSYGERCLLIEVTPAELEERWRDLQAMVAPYGGIVLPPRILWHSHFRHRKGHLIHPRRPPRRRKDRARWRRETMLRDKQRILDACSTTAQS